MNSRMGTITCRQCGADCNIFDLRKKKTCPHCGQIALPIDIKEVHVYFNDMIWGEPAKLPRESEHAFLCDVDYTRVCFDLQLTIGDISHAPRLNSSVHAHTHLCYQSEKKAIDLNIQKLSEISDNVIVYLWVNDRDVNAYLNLLKFAELFKRFDEIWLIRCYTKEEEENEEYEENDSFAKRQRIFRDDLDEMSRKYAEILKFGGDYRGGRFGEVRVFSKEYMEELIMRHIKNNHQTFNSIYDAASDEFEKKTGYVLNYRMVKELVWQLMVKGQIKSKEPYVLWGKSECDGKMWMHSFCLSTPKSITYTCDDALDIIYKAFEIGDTLPLYDIIADDAVLEFAYKKQTIRSKPRIINFIENDGVYRVVVRNAESKCTYVREQIGRRKNDLGERCIALWYMYNRYRSPIFVIKLQFENNRIIKIQVFKPMRTRKLMKDE